MKIQKPGDKKKIPIDFSDEPDIITVDPPAPPKREREPWVPPSARRSDSDTGNPPAPRRPPPAPSPSPSPPAAAPSPSPAPPRVVPLPTRPPAPPSRPAPAPQPPQAAPRPPPAPPRNPVVLFPGATAVAATYYRKINVLKITSNGRQWVGGFKSTPRVEGRWGGAIAPGTYAILAGNRKTDNFRLEALDANFGDDTVDATGQSLLRLHGPGGSAGCITALDSNEWGQARQLISRHNAGTAEVRRYWGPSVHGIQPFRIERSESEFLRLYGFLRVE